MDILALKTALYWLGILLIVASIVVGVLWVIRDGSLEAKAFVLVTTGTLLLVLMAQQ